VAWLCMRAPIHRANQSLRGERVVNRLGERLRLHERLPALPSNRIEHARSRRRVRAEGKAKIAGQSSGVCLRRLRENRMRFDLLAQRKGFVCASAIVFLRVGWVVEGERDRAIGAGAIFIMFRHSTDEQNGLRLVWGKHWAYPSSEPTPKHARKNSSASAGLKGLISSTRYFSRAARTY